jgi:hypothetical protein
LHVHFAENPPRPGWLWDKSLRMRAQRSKTSLDIRLCCELPAVRARVGRWPGLGDGAGRLGRDPDPVREKPGGGRTVVAKRGLGARLATTDQENARFFTKRGSHAGAT